jgi:hypothetical protein
VIRGSVIHRFAAIPERIQRLALNGPVAQWL